jgi:hypothetical protein
MSFQGVKRPERGVGYTHTHIHLAPRLEKEYSCTSTPLWAFVASYTVNFTFTNHNRSDLAAAKQLRKFTHYKDMDMTLSEYQIRIS